MGIEEILEIVEAEPELPGEPSAETLDVMRSRPVDFLRATVRATKKSIARRITAASQEELAP